MEQTSRSAAIEVQNAVSDGDADWTKRPQVANKDTKRQILNGEVSFRVVGRLNPAGGVAV